MEEKWKGTGNERTNERERGGLGGWTPAGQIHFSLWTQIGELQRSRIGFDEGRQRSVGTFCEELGRVGIGVEEGKIIWEKKMKKRTIRKGLWGIVIIEEEGG